MFWWNYFCNAYKDYYKRKCSKELLFCNNFGQIFFGTFCPLLLCTFIGKFRICLWRTPQRVANFVLISFSTNFIVKHTQGGCKSCFNVSYLSSSLPSFDLVFLFLLLLYISKPEFYPEARAACLYIVLLPLSCATGSATIGSTSSQDVCLCPVIAASFRGPPVIRWRIVMEPGSVTFRKAPFRNDP